MEFATTNKGQQKLCYQGYMSIRQKDLANEVYSSKHAKIICVFFKNKYRFITHQKLKKHFHLSHLTENRWELVQSLVVRRLSLTFSILVFSEITDNINQTWQEWSVIGSPSKIYPICSHSI